MQLEGGEVFGGEIPELCLDGTGVDHVAGAGVAGLPWDPGQNLLPRRASSALLKVYHVVGATMGRRVENEHLHIFQDNFL